MARDESSPRAAGVPAEDAVPASAPLSRPRSLPRRRAKRWPFARPDLLQRWRIIGKLIGRDPHPLIESRPRPFGAVEPADDSLCRSQPANTGWAVRTGR